MILTLRRAAILSFCLVICCSVPLPRAVRIHGRTFVSAQTGAPIVLRGPNVVVKGPPYLPDTNGTTVCKDIVNDECTAHGNCSSCTSFNSADAENIIAQGWNAIRLGIVWAGAQPKNEDSLDADFLLRLHSVLALCDQLGLVVVLDNHGDMVGGQGCGNGIPAWFQALAAPELIGTPLSTGFPYNLIPSLEITTLDGWSTCGNDTEKWKEFAGDDNYNLKNECCKAMNAGGNPGQLGYTLISQRTMDYLLMEGPGRDAFVRFWRLVAEAVVDHPSAALAELMNEPSE